MSKVFELSYRQQISQSVDLDVLQAGGDGFPGPEFVDKVQADRQLAEAELADANGRVVELVRKVLRPARSDVDEKEAREDKSSQINF